MRPKIALLAILGDFILLFALFILCLPFLINTSFVKTKILDFVHERTGINIPAQEFYLYVTITGGKPYLVSQFNDTELSFFSEDKVCIGHAQVEWGIIDILKGRPICSAITINDVKINLSQIKKLNDIKINLSRTKQDIIFKEILSHYFNYILSYLPKYQKKADLIFNNVSCHFFSSASGICSIDRNKKSLECKVNIQNIFIKKNQILEKKSLIQVLPLQQLKAGELDFNIKIDIFNNKISANAVLKKLIIDSSKLKHSLTFQSDIKFKFSGHPEKFDFQVGAMAFRYPRGVLTYNWSFDKNRKQKWKMLFSGEKINLDQVGSVCLSLGNQNVIIQNLFDILQAGKADKVKVGFASNLLEDMFDPYKMTISGDLEDGKIHIPTTPYLLTQSNGKAVMKEGVLKVDANSGSLGNTRILSSHFEIDLLHNYDFPFHGEFNLDADIAQIPQVILTLLPESLFTREIKKIKSASGRTQGVLVLDYQPGKPLKIKVDAKKIKGSIDYEPFESNLNIQKGRLVYNNKNMSLENIFADMGKNRIMDFSGHLSFSSPYLMELASGKFFIEPGQFIAPLKNFSFLPPNILENISGTITINSLFIKGPCLKPSKWKYDLSGETKNLELQLPNEIDKALTRLQMKLLSGHFFINQDYLDWENSTKPWTKVRLKKLKNGFNIQLDHINICDLITKGNLFLYLKEQNINIDTSLQIKSKENSASLPLFACLLENESFMEGPYKISCNLEYQGPVKDFQKGIKGELSFYSSNGRIYKATFLERVLSVINVLNLEGIGKKGFNYNFIKINGTIKNGKLFLSNAVIDAENMFLMFTGWVDLFEDKLDLICFVAPLKTIDSIIKHIPLVNLIIGNKIISIPIGIKGNRNEPDIVILNPSEIGKGALRLIEHILTAPARLFQGKRSMKVFE